MASSVPHLLAACLIAIATMPPSTASGEPNTADLLAAIELLRGNENRRADDTDQGILALVATVAVGEGLHPQLFRALVECESGLDPGARSRKGAIGLCQLMPCTAKELRVNPYHVSDNLSGGARYLRRLLLRFKDVRTALWAYNFGPSAVAAGRPAPTETRLFADRVIARYAELCNEER